MNLTDFSKRKSIAILLGFLTAFLLSRFIVFCINSNIGTFLLKYNIIGEYHIHHFTYGIIIISLVGFAALFIPDRHHNTWLFIAYGFGLGLIFDEFGIWLKLDPRYNDELSYVAVIFVSGLLVISALIEREYRKIHFLKDENFKIKINKKFPAKKLSASKSLKKKN